MTPLDLAQSLARSDAREDRVLGAAIVARSLSDDSPDRAGWPPEAAASAAVRYLGLDSNLVAEVIAAAPSVSDAMLNRPVIPQSPFTRRALAGQLPAKDVTR